ncbi:MAG: hypothetical protein LBP64_04240 [Tannerella sp.]|jgi:hypothetical protein|nr:hypothetical protein [Tannerella sp.]
MSAKIYRRREVNRIVLTGVVLFGLLEEAAICFLFPQYYTCYMLFIPCYFLLLAVSLLWGMAHFRAEQIHIRRALARMMLLNVSQFITSAAIIVCYALFVGEQKNAFILAFGLYYIWFLGLKLFVFYNMEHFNKFKRLQNKKK